MGSFLLSVGVFYKLLLILGAINSLYSMESPDKVNESHNMKTIAVKRKVSR